MPVTAKALLMLLKWRISVIIGNDILELHTALLSEVVPGSPGSGLSSFGLDGRQSFSRK